MGPRERPIDREFLDPLSQERPKEMAAMGGVLFLDGDLPGFFGFEILKEIGLSKA
jgi:hypothetical protein